MHVSKQQVKYEYERKLMINPIEIVIARCYNLIGCSTSQVFFIYVCMYLLRQVTLRVHALTYFARPSAQGADFPPPLAGRCYLPRISGRCYLTHADRRAWRYTWSIQPSSSLFMIIFMYHVTMVDIDMVLVCYE
jgi:hypothetical protein